ncbi:MAG: YggT family protein [Clostridia bacterium]|nr:YggT family protein [Clostridia bacterium]
MRQIIWWLLTLLQYIMLLAAIASWIPQLYGTKLHSFLQRCTEPVTAPFRKLLNRIPAVRDFPLDISFLAAYLALTILKRLVY